jgi:hypothetical protein
MIRLLAAAAALLVVAGVATAARGQAASAGDPARDYTFSALVCYTQTWDYPRTCNGHAIGLPSYQSCRARAAALRHMLDTAGAHLVWWECHRPGARRMK